jgi:hypothetical protein
MSEAGASIVDECFGLNVVPKTRVVRLTSPSFHYSSFDRARARAVKSASKSLPETVRSLFFSLLLLMSRGRPFSSSSPHEGSLFQL